MANIKSAQKKNRQRIKNEARNRSQKSALRTAVKKVRAALASKKPGDAKALLVPAIRLLDRAGGKGLIKKRNSSRSVARLVAAVNAAPAK